MGIDEVYKKYSGKRWEKSGQKLVKSGQKVGKG